MVRGGLDGFSKVLILAAVLLCLFALGGCQGDYEEMTLREKEQMIIKLLAAGFALSGFLGWLYWRSGGSDGYGKGDIEMPWYRRLMWWL